MDKEPLRVFFKGNPDANVFILGEGPGGDEILAGKPFIGRAGKKLNELLAHAGIPFGDVCVANTFVCSGDGKIKPTYEVMVLCNNWRDLFNIAGPKIFINLGMYAFRASVIGTKDEEIAKVLMPNLSVVLGKEYKYKSKWSYHEPAWFIEYHPAYLLRNPPAETETLKRWAFIGKRYEQLCNIVGS